MRKTDRVTRMRKEERVTEIYTLLRTRNYTVSSYTLNRFSAQEITRIHRYLTDTPRTTALGRVMELGHAARVLGVTMRDGATPWRAMQFDVPDGRTNGGIDAALYRCGLPALPDDFDQMSSTEINRLAAALYAEEYIYTNIHYRKDKSAETFTGFMELVQRRPADTERILAFARARQTLDAGLMEEFLNNASGALEAGVL